MALPECKIKSRGGPNRRGHLLATNIRTSEIYRPNAVNDYIAKKKKEIKDMHTEINRVTMGYIVDL